MRRKDREMSTEFAYSVANKCEYAVMSMVDVSGAPYCVPVTIVLDGTDTLYFHSAKEGFKVDCLRANPCVCIACVGDTLRLKDKFTTLFESAILRGRAVEVTSDDEKVRALRLLSIRHTPSNMSAFDAAVEGSLARTAVWRVEISEITGKCKK